MVYWNGSSGKITEYSGGLSGCSGTVLGATVAFPGGMVLDKNSNLVICDQNAEAVDIIKPPYSRISGTLGSGYSDPTTVTDQQDEHAGVCRQLRRQRRARPELSRRLTHCA